MKNSYTKLLTFLFIIAVYHSGPVQAQTTVYFNDFPGTGGSTAVPGGTIGSATFTNVAGSPGLSNVQTGGTDGVTNFNNNQLTEWVHTGSGGFGLPSRNSSYSQTTSPLSGYLAPFNSTLSANTSLVTWTFNMRTSEGANGFSSGGDDNAVVILAGTNASVETAGQGYAVAFNPVSNRRIEFIRYNGGVTGATQLINSSVQIGSSTNYASVMVTYDPASNLWSLFVRDDGNAFNDPATSIPSALAAAGTAIDNTYTGTPMSIFGFYSPHQANPFFFFFDGDAYSYFDNYKVVVACGTSILGAVTSVCPGSTITLSNATTGGTWSSGSTAIATVTSATGIVSGVISGTSTISYTNPVGCTTTQTVTVNSVAPAFTVTPSSATFCSGSQMLTAPNIAGTNITTTFVQTSAPFTIPITTPSGVTDNILVSGIPPGAIINDVAVKLNNVIEQFDYHLTFNIQAPNGANLNLVYQEGPRTAGGATANFTNTIISSLGGITFPSSNPPYTNTYTADAIIAVGPTAFPSTVTTWPPLFTVPNGNWTLCARHDINTNYPIVTVNQWSLIIHYTTPSGTYTWSPATGLYTNSTLTTNYIAGATTNTVYASPAATTTYTATATISGSACTSSSTATITISGAGGGIIGATTLCSGQNTTLSTSVTGGIWSSSNTNVATVTPGPGAGGGVVSGITAGTVVISYTNGCTSTTTITVTAPPGAISGTTSICANATATLSDAIAGGTWSSGNTAVATVITGPSTTTTVSGFGSVSGTSVITYSNGCLPDAVTTVTVTPAPGPVLSTATTVCKGLAITLSDAVAGGTWTSGSTTVATVTPGPGAGGGIVAGVSAGTSIITYSTGCGTTATISVTVQSPPTIISGAAIICLGGTTTLSNNGSPTGTWSSSVTAVATIDPVSGSATGITSGQTLITATNICGSTSASLTVSSPSAITGVLTFCQNSTTTLSNAVTGGTWSSSAPGVATTTGGTDGVIYGIGLGFSPGTAPITYTLPTGCIATTTITTTSAPTGIFGVFSVCTGLVTNLTDGTIGGVWTSTNTSVATVGSTGDVHGFGVSGGSTVISYAIGSCAATATVLVNPLPGPILGPSQVCALSAITLTNDTTGGTWSSSNTAAATVGVLSGSVTGVAPALPVSVTDTITYRLVTGCQTTKTITVNPLPAVITGNTTICAGQTTTLSDITASGTWSSSNTAVATIAVPTASTVTGSAVTSQGTSTISYTLPTGCFTTTVVTVNPLPGAITGAMTVCAGATSALTDAPAGGTWISGNTAAATIDPNTGVLTGAGVLTQQTTLITYSLSTGCSAQATATVNPVPVAISGGAIAICAGATAALTDQSSGGTWSSSNTNVATVVTGTGAVTGSAVASQGTDTIIYRLPTGCSAQTTMTVNPAPTPIIGNTAVCVGLTIALTDGIAGGTWSSSTTNISIGTSSGIVTGLVAGSPVVTYTLPTGCTRTVNITVNALPTVIAGAGAVCAGLSTTLSDGTAGGTWSSSNTNVATVGVSGAAAGIVTGRNILAVDSAAITYTLGTGCLMTRTVVVNPLPVAITGITSVCVGLTTQLSDGTAGGTWSTGNTTIATIGSVSGQVTGGAVATQSVTPVTYTLIATGCTVTTNVTVNPLPTNITGNTAICAGLTTILSNGTVGGTWTSGNTAVATVLTTGASSGVVTGVSTGAGSAGGTAVITYTLGSGCIRTATVTVNPLPGAIIGNLTICAGLTTTLSDTTSGGTWSSATTGVATVVGGTGVVTGSNVSVQGTSRITYTIISTGCTATANVTVNPLPGTINGSASLCQGTTINLSEATAGGTWSSSNTLLATISGGPGTGSVLFAGAAGGPVGVDTVTYTLGTGCIQTKTVTVNLQPAPVTGGPLQLCNHSSASLSDVTGGGTWSSSNTAVATVDGNGLVTGSIPGAGIGGGTANIIYSIGGCSEATFVNVAVQPVGITGVLTMCNGAGTTLHDATPGGVWSAGNTVVSVVSAGTTGTVSSNDTGQSVITYAIGNCSVTTTVTVNLQPSQITGTGFFCNLSSVTLSDAVPGGVWSSSSSNVAVGSATGVVTGVHAGTAVISYTEPVGGCFAARSVTINIQPSVITGTAQVCNGLTTQLSDSAASGTWSVSAATISIATVSVSGQVTGLSAGAGGNDGVAVISYTIGSCSSVDTVLVHPLPSVMTGAFFVCAGSQTTLGDLSAPGTWSSNTPAVATIGVATGIVSGVTTGVTMITYTLPTGCITAHSLTVIAAPAAITGSNKVCEGGSTQLSDTTTGGVWTSSNTGTAQIGSLSGIVTGVSAGTVVISYTLGSGCRVVAPLVVHPLSPVTGTATVCMGLTTNLSDTTVGGIWSSGNTNIATVSAIGVVSGVGSGTAVISYTLPTGCVATATVTTLGLPALITGITGVCQGQTTMLSDASGGGVWSSANTVIATIDPLTGQVTGGSFGGSTAVNTTIIYTQGGCPRTTVVTVNPPPAPISGSTDLCVGSAEQVSDATAGGAWTSSNTAAATIDAAGVVSGVSAGTTTIIYTSITGCTTGLIVTVHPLPSAISGNTTVCEGSVTQLSDSPGGGGWTSGSPLVATVNFTTGMVTGVSGGTAVITYRVVTGCMMTTTVTVHPLPSGISGSNNVCEGSQTNLFCTPAGGAWSSSNSAVATIDAVTGVVSGLTAGTTLISYTVGTGCASTLLMTVNPLPPAITGISMVCTGMTTQLFDAAPGGTWSSSNTAIGTVDQSGVVYGGTAPGSFIVTYTLPTGCYVTIGVGVNIPPVAIGGLTVVCEGSRITLSDGVKGGLWSSDNTAIATINAVSGVLTGVSGGSVVITYTMGGGSCFVTYIVTVNPLPAVITGNRSVCQGLTTQLFDATGGGLWSSLGTAVATIEASSGIVSGVSAGTSLVSYTLIATGCASTAVVTVNRLPDPVSGNTNVCLGGTRTLSDSPSPGTWSSSNTAIATVDVLTGIVTGGAIGIDTITYTITATGCIMTTTIAVHALPAVFGVTGGGSYRQTTGGVHIGLSGSETGVIYLLYLGSTPAGTYTGTGHPLDFGLQVPGGTYTVIATNGFTTCSSNMSGSAVVTVIPYIVPTVSIGTSPGDTVCSGTVVTYTATATGGGAGPVYVWRVNGTGVGTGSAYSFIPANGDEVSVFMTSNVACAIPATVSDTVRMTVQTPVLPTVGIMASPGDTVCTGTAVTFTAVPSAGGSGPVYLWIVNGAFKGTGTVYTYTPADGDLVYCSMVSNYQCRLGDTVTGGPERMVADTPVIPVVTVVASPGRESGSYDTVRAVVVNGKSPRYQWFVNGIPVSGATTAMYVSNGFHYPKADSVGCVVVNSDACHESAFGWIYVTLHSLGVTHVTGGISDLSVIPNPNKGAFTVSGTLGGSADQEVTIELTDMLGQKVYEEKTLARGGRLSRQITLSNTLANGMYMLSVRGDDGTHKVFHLVVEQ